MSRLFDKLCKLQQERFIEGMAERTHWTPEHIAVSQQQLCERCNDTEHCIFELTHENKKDGEVNE